MEFDESEPEPIVAPDTPNMTKLNPEEGPDGERLDGFETFHWHYTILRRMNRGTHLRSEICPYKTWTDREKIRLIDNLGIYDSIVCQLDLKASQKRWGKQIFKRLNFKRYSQPNDGGLGIAVAAFSVAAYICWRNDEQTHPNQPDRDDRFQRLQASLGFSDDQFETWYGRIENELRTHRGNSPRLERGRGV